MHNQNRQEYKSRLLNPNTSSSLSLRARQYSVITCNLQTRRIALRSRLLGNPITTPKRSMVEQRRDKETLRLIENVVRVHPDPLGVWNHRRELLRLDLKRKGDDEEEYTFDIKKEQELTEQCLHKNPKAYGVWFHRKWVIQSWLHVEMDRKKKGYQIRCQGELKNELKLCARLLDFDERNFHW